MTFDITKTAQNLKDQINIRPQIVLELEGIPLKFSTADVLRMPRLDEGYFLDEGLFLDTPIKDPNSRALIALKGTSREITSQLFPEKGGAGSIQSFKIVLQNKNNELTQYFQTDNFVDDILATDARVWLSFQGAEFPNDYIKIFDGYVDNFEIAHNEYTLSVAIPTQRVRQSLFNIISTKLDGAITDVQTDLTVDFTSGFITPTAEQEEYIESYIQIDEEIIKLSDTNTATEFQSVTRGQLNTAQNAHDDDTEVTSFIRLKGNPIDLALRLLLSNPKDEYYVSGQEVDRIVRLSDSETINNAIFFKVDIEQEYNVKVGDTCNVAGATEVANNFIGRTVVAIELTNDGSYIVVDGNGLTLEASTAATIEFKSQYNVLPEKAGLGMKPNFVDIDGILELDTLLGASLPDIDIYVKDEIKAKEWLEREIFKPVGLFGLNRKGRYSIYAALPPLNTGETTFINENNILNITSLKIKRSTTKNHYNSIVYKFEQDSLEDDFKAGVIVVSQTSVNRIPVGNKQLTIEAAGLRDDTPTRAAIDRQAQRLIDKYQFAPQYIEGVQVKFKDAYTLEVGDSVIFGAGNNLQVPDTETGSLNFPETLMQVSNIKLDVKKAIVTLDLINSAFGLNGRFGVISPSSYIQSDGSDFVVLKRSFTTTDLQVETRKWEEFVGRKVRIRDVGFTKEQILTVKEIAEDLENKLVFEENITISVDEDDILDLPDYEEAEEYHKKSYVFMNPQVEVTTSISDTQLEAVTTNLFEGATVRIHNDDYTERSEETIISDITGTVITFEDTLNYTPAIGDKIELIGFVADSGLPYRYI